MNRRILLALLTLVGAVLLGAVVPLGYATAHYDRTNFTGQATDTARALAAVAEENLSGHEPDTSSVLRGPLSDGNDRGTANVYGPAGQLLISTGAQPAISAVDLAAGLRGRSSHHTVRFDDQHELVVVVPVGDSGTPLGVLAFTRSTRHLDDQLHQLAIALLSVSALALLAAGLIAAALSRWIARPLHQLDRAAAGLGNQSASHAPLPAGGPPEVRQLAATLAGMTQRIDGLLRHSQELMADVSHQLRTPLTALQLRLELLGEDVVPDAAGEIRGVLSEVARLSRLLDGLLSVARAEHNPPTLRPIDLGEIVQGRIESWRPLAHDRSVQLTATPNATARDVLVLSAPGRLEQVLDNLIANALAAVHPEGEITITADHDSRNVVVGVADNGPGIPADQRDLLLRRFWSDRQRVSPTQGQGTGLGLAIAHRLINADGGQLELADAPTGGLLARFTLPLATAATPPTHDTGRPPKHHRRHEHQRGTPTDFEAPGR